MPKLIVIDTSGITPTTRNLRKDSVAFNSADGKIFLNNGEEIVTISYHFTSVSSGNLTFGNKYYLGSDNTFTLSNIENLNKGDALIVAREGTFEPVVTLSSEDIAAGKKIRMNGYEVTNFIVDKDEMITLIYNGNDLEVRT